MRQEEKITIALHLFICLIGLIANLFAPIITLAFRSQTAIDIHTCICFPLLWIAHLMRLNLGFGAYFYTIFGLWGVIFFGSSNILVGKMSQTFRRRHYAYWLLDTYPCLMLLRAFTGRPEQEAGAAP
jgi:hypothetical protein